MENELENIIIEYTKKPTYDNSHINFGLNELTNILREHKGKVDDIYWRIYFDLLRFDKNKPKFEIAAESYTKALNKTPPSWIEDGDCEIEENGVNILKLKDLKNISKAKKEDFINLVKNGVFSRLDFSQTTLLSMEENNLKGVVSLAELLMEIKGYPCQIIGVMNLLNYLEEKIKQKNIEKEYWILLLALYQSIGYEKEYEKTALEYIDTYEETTPEYNKRFILKQQFSDDRLEDLKKFNLPKIVEKSDIINLTMFIDEKNKTTDFEILINAQKTQFIQYSALEELARYIIENKEIIKKSIIFENLSQIIVSSLEAMGVDKNVVTLKTIKYG